MKTIEQAAKEQSAKEVLDGNDTDAMFCNRIGMKQIIERVFKAGAQFAQRFIPVDEELPPEIDSVILKRADPFRYEIVGFLCKGRYYSSETGNNLTKVTHWRKIEIL